MVERGLPKPETRVRFPSPAPIIIKHLQTSASKVQVNEALEMPQKTFGPSCRLPLFGPPEGERLASGSNGREAVELYDLATQQDMATLAGSGSLFRFTRFSSDGNLIVAINSDQQVQLWHAPSWEEIAPAAAKQKTESKQP